MLLLTHAYAAESPRWGIADRDAGCGLVVMEAVLDLELQSDAAFDQFIGELLPYAAWMPVPDECADRLSVYVDSVAATDVRLCARITGGPGLGRNFCSGLDARIVEQTDEVLSDPVEPGGGPMPGASTDFDRSAAPPRVVEVQRDGRVVALLDAAQTMDCAEGFLGALATRELSMDAAFDTYSTDLDELGFRFDGWGSCQAYIGVRVASVSWPDDFRVEVVLLEGDLRGQVYAMGADIVVEESGRITTNRARLAADGWTLSDPLPR